MGKRVQLPTSPVLGPTIVAQATIDRLDVSMQGNPNHPMRVAMFDHTVADVQPTYIEPGAASRCSSSPPSSRDASPSRP
eukprot:3287992-Pleurochrysis_carterae.AAC.1